MQTLTIDTVNGVIRYKLKTRQTDVDASELHSVVVNDDEDFVRVTLATPKVDEDRIHPINDNITIDGQVFSGDKYDLANAISSVLASTATGSPACGWGFYVDDATSTLLVDDDQYYKLPINGLAGNTNTDYLPSGSALWDSVGNKITPVAVGDAYDLRVQLEIIATNSNPSRLEIALDIGGAASPSIVITQKALTLKTGVPQTVIFSFPFFSLGTFVTNGGQLFLKTTSGSLTISERSVLLVKTC